MSKNYGVKHIGHLHNDVALKVGPEIGTCDNRSRSNNVIILL